MLALQNNYDGKSEGKLRKQITKDDRNMLFYSNEIHFIFQEVRYKDETTI